MTGFDHFWLESIIFDLTLKSHFHDWFWSFLTWIDHCWLISIIFDLNRSFLTWLEKKSLSWLVLIIFDLNRSFLTWLEKSHFHDWFWSFLTWMRYFRKPYKRRFLTFKANVLPQITKTGHVMLRCQPFCHWGWLSMEWVLAKYHHRKHNSITKNTNAMQKSVIFQLIKTCYSLPKNVWC